METLKCVSCGRRAISYNKVPIHYFASYRKLFIRKVSRNWLFSNKKFFRRKFSAKLIISKELIMFYKTRKTLLPNVLIFKWCEKRKRFSREMTDSRNITQQKEQIWNEGNMHIFFANEKIPVPHFQVISRWSWIRISRCVPEWAVGRLMPPRDWRALVYLTNSAV